MSHRSPFVAACLVLSFCGVLVSAAGCSGALIGGGGSDATDAGGPSADARLALPPEDDASIDDYADAALDDVDAGALDDEDAGLPVELDAGMPPVDPGPAPDAGTPPPPTAPRPDPRHQAEMTFATVNIGREYDTRAQVRSVIVRVRDTIAARIGPKLIGWQEIGESDPCGSCEIEVIRNRLTAADGWDTRRPSGTRPDGNTEAVKVPVTSRGAGTPQVRAVFASPGWSGVSPTRFVTVAYYPDRNISFINTHLIAGAWSCRSEVSRRRDYWRRGWSVLREQVALEHGRGRNVIVTGDLNRPRAASSCNPSWDPASLHSRARVIGGTGIDYIFAVPAVGWSFTLSRRADGTVRRGTIELGIDSHQGHWVTGRFQKS